MHTRPTSSWNSVLAKLGLSRKLRNYSRGRSRRHNERRLRLELLESRKLLAVFSVSNLNDTGSGSLRDAINMANNVAGADEIQFSVNGTIDIASQLPTITDDLTITGPGADLLTINAGNGTDGIFATGDGFRIFNIDDGEVNNDLTVTLNSLILTGGDVQNRGGAIFNLENLTITNSTVTGNVAVTSLVAPNGGAEASGGGIYSSGGQLHINESTISNNIAIVDFRDQLVETAISARVRGGGIFALNGNVKIANSTISGNSAISDLRDLRDGQDSQVTYSSTFTFGGGVHVTGNNLLDISRSTISDNGARNLLENSGIKGSAGAVWSYGGGVYSRMSTTIRESTISGNVASSTGILNGVAIIESSVVRGAGIFINQLIGTLASDILSSTISANTLVNTVFGNLNVGPRTAQGGGLYFDGSGNAPLVISFSTIAENAINLAAEPDNIRVAGAGVFADGVLRLDHAILANNVRPIIQIGGLAILTPDDLDSVFVTADFSLVEGTNESLLGTGNIEGQDPDLGPLQNNGGPTKTYALNSGSPAIDAGDPMNTPSMLPEISRVLILVPNALGILQSQSITAFSVDFDQRSVGFPRVFDLPGVDNTPMGVSGESLVDIGAFEVQSIALNDADFDDDGDVDGSDFLTWQRGFGITSGATPIQGDADGDTDVDAADLGVWSGQFGASLLVAASVENDQSADTVGTLQLESAAAAAVINRVDFRFAVERQEGKILVDRGSTSYSMTLQAQTHALQPSNSAIEAAVDSIVQALELLTDQREITSLDDDNFDGLVRTDFGAFELGVDEFFGNLGT